MMHGQQNVKYFPLVYDTTLTKCALNIVLVLTQYENCSLQNTVCRFHVY